MTIVVTLTERQERQLLMVADELKCALHEVGERAIVAFLETHGHHAKGPERALNAGYIYDRKTNTHRKGTTE